MDERNEQPVDSEFHLDAEPKDKSQNETKEKKVQSHVLLRHGYGSGSEETGFSVKGKTDSDALESVYWYARKIKSFLGWEPNKEDSDWSKSSNKPIGENFKVKKDCDNNEIKESVFYKSGQENNSTKIFIAGVTDSPNINNFSDSYRECNDCEGASALRIGEIHYILHNEQKERDATTIKLQVPEINECDVNLLEENTENTFQEETFRSEINIYVDGSKYYTDVAISSIEKELPEGNCFRSKLFVNRNMDEPLAQEDKSEVGLNLNDADDILRDELQVESFANIQADTSCIFNMPLKLEKGITESYGTFENDKLSENIVEKQPRSECQIILDQNCSLVDVTRPNVEFVRKLSLGVVKDVIESAQNSVHEVLNKKNEHVEHNTASDVNKLDSNSEEKKNDEKHLENGTNEVENAKRAHIVASQNNKLPNMDSTIKAYIAYKNEKNKPLISKNAPCMEKQGMERKDSVFADEDTICGLGSFRPRCMQQWATAKVYVILYSVLGILHGSYYSYLIGTLSTLEKRFAFKSKISGTIMMADEVTPLLLGVIIGYYAGKGHRPRIVAIGMLLSAGCCFATALPYFIYGSGQHLTDLNARNETGSDVCDGDIQIESCDPDERPPTLPAVLFLILGSFLKGFGNLAYYAIGLAYMDDNSEKNSTPIYLAIALALRLLGPLLGYLMSSIFLKFYENPFEDPGFGPDDPRWIGAWWIGFILQGVLLVICTLPIALFPRRLPNHRKPELKASSAKKESIKEMFSGLVNALKRLGKNPIFIFMTINTVLTIFGHFGHAIMLPKYMENQFKLSASDASLFSGATAVACMMVSTVFGGFLMWKFRPSSKLLLKGMIASEITMCIGYLCLMLPQCQLSDMSNFGKNDLGLILNGQCNQNCDCTTAAFTPFCGEDGKTMYFSPCYAGCTQQLTLFMSEKEKKGFGNCSCVPDEDGAMVGQVTEGFCPDENCWTQTLAYICLLLFLITISSTLTVANTMILLRSVHPSDKSLALGTFETFCCLFGFIPFPITYGAIVDSACLVWEKSCGQTGNCWFYDMTKYRYMLHGFSSFFCFLTVFCFISLYCLRSRIRNLYEEEHDDKEEPVTIKLDTVSGSVTKL